MKVFFSSFLGVIAGLFFILFISILIGVAASSSSTDMEVSDNTTLQITLEGLIEDRPNSANQVLLELLDLSLIHI